MKKEMNRRGFLSVAAALSSTLLGACAAPSKRQEYGDTSRMFDVNMQMDKMMMRSGGIDGTDQEMISFQIEYVNKATKLPYMFKDEFGNATPILKFWETARDAPFVQKLALTMAPATFVAYLNGRTARSVADKCPDGKCGPSFSSNNSTVINVKGNCGADCGN